MKSRPWALAIVILLSVVTPVAPVAARDRPRRRPAEVGLSASRLSRIGELREALVAEGRLAGARAVVARRSKTVYFNVWGTRDRESGAPVTRKTTCDWGGIAGTEFFKVLVYQAEVD